MPRDNLKVSLDPSIDRRLPSPCFTLAMLSDQTAAARQLSRRRRSLKILLTRHQSPTDACHFVGERYGSELALLGGVQFGEPGIVFGAFAAQDRHGSVDEKSAQITVTALADRPKPDLSAGAVLTRDQPERGGEVPSALEDMRIGDHRGHGAR